MLFESPEHYDINEIKRYLLLAVAGVLLWRLTAGMAVILLPVVVIASVVRRKSVELLFELLFIVFTLVGNRQLLVPNAIAMTVVRITLMLMTALLWKNITAKGNDSYLFGPFWGLFAYLGWETLVSVQGFSPVVSFLKLFLFVTIFMAMIGMASTVNRSPETNSRQLRSAVLAVISLVLFGSILLVPFPSLGMMVGEEALKAIRSGELVSLFQGMTCQTQVLGTLTAILGTFVFADLAFSLKKWDKFYLALLVACPVLIYMTSSRTGMGTLFAGTGMVIFLVMRGRGVTASWKGRLMSTFNLLLVVGAIAVCAVPSARDKVGRFVFKQSAKSVVTDTSFDAMVSTRQELMDESARNFRDKPLLGNGFQVSRGMSGMKRSGLMSYLSAPIEKGVWIYAIPEEGGIIGMAIFCAWLVVMFRHLLAYKAYICACVFFAFVTANFGEFTFFSMSYLGGFGWALTFAALCLDWQRIKAETLPEQASGA